MKAVILAGGLGTRISEESIYKPKPMIEIGGKPIIWHVMKIYSSYGIYDFIICLGYKGYLIKEYFANYFLHMSDVSFDLSCNQMTVHDNQSEPWKVTLIDTGIDTNTGGRIKKVKDYLKNEDIFCCTYGDGLGNINISELINLHKKEKRFATLTATQPPGRFGVIALDQNKVVSFNEKPCGDGSWINGGFFVLSQKIFNYIDNDQIVWEREPLEKLALERQLAVYRHNGFWQPMDTVRDKNFLETLWASGNPPWKTW